MAYIVFHKADVLNEAAPTSPASMTADALKNANINVVQGLGGIDIPVNNNGYLKGPGNRLPAGMLDKLKDAWGSSNGDVDAFFNQRIDGRTVKDILGDCPSQQSFDIAAKLDLPDGTNVPCQEFTDKGYTAIKYHQGDAGLQSVGDGTAGTSDPIGDDGIATTPTTPPADTGTDTTPPAGDSGTDAGGDWWKFFGTKEVLIGAVAVAGILAIIKALGNTIKARFRKCAKVLYNMQKDFGTKADGMDMKAVLPGVGSKITDWITRLWGMKKGPGKNRGALGLRPFVDNYRNELAGDYQEARKALNMIAAQGKGLNAKGKEEQNSGKMDNFQKESQQVVYSSFTEMFKSEPLNESEGQLNESLAGIVAIGSLAIKAGMYLFTKKDKNGNPIGDPKPVQVTKQSTREICYSILNMFFSKYFDMKSVSAKLGMHVESLGDIDSSNVDKFAKLAAAMKQEQAQSSASKMYKRVEKNYDEMVAAYGRIADTVVNNFEKFTKKRKGLDGKVKELSEKDSNLLVASTEKLKAEVARQKDMYTNNFFRVVNAIITSPEYTTYIDFIIKDVIPVFKTGLASDADYVLDIVPKAGEYYVIHQTNQQSEYNDGDKTQENVVLVKVLDFNQDGENAKNPVIEFSRVARIKDPAVLKKGENNEYDLSSLNVDTLDKTAYGKEAGQRAEEANDKITLKYNQWMALDPVTATNVPGDVRDGGDTLKTKLYKRTIGEIDEYVFGISTNVKESTDEVKTYNEQNISEADVEAKVTDEEPKSEDSEDTANNEEQPKEVKAEDNTANIIKLAVINVKTGSNLFDDPKQTGANRAYINLETKCNAKQLDDKLKSLQFVPLDNMIKEKEHIEKLIADNFGHVLTSAYTAKDINTIDDSLKALETRQTTSEQLFAALDKLADNLYQKVASLGLKPEQLTAEISLGGGVNRGTFITLPKAKQSAPYYQPFDTNVKDLLGRPIGFNYYPALINADGSVVVSQEAQPQVKVPNGAMVGIVIAINNIVTNQVKDSDKLKNIQLFHAAKLDKESIKAALSATIKDLITVGNIEAPRNIKLGGDDNQQDNVSSSFTVEYDKYFNIAESFMSSFGFNGANQLHVNRTIKGPESKLTYYALSENAWGDGSKLDPEKYLKESLDNILKKNSTYDDFAKLAKSSHTINLVKIAEDCSYNTAFPYNRYQMLTAANPLYEALVIVRFDEEGNLVEAIRTGVKKIYCETI